MSLIKILREKIDRESEWTWRYEVFKENIETYLKQSEKVVHTRKIDTGDWPKWPNWIRQRYVD